MKLYLNNVGLLCAVGNSRSEILTRLLSGDRSGLIATDEFGFPAIVGQVTGALPEIDSPFYACRNNQLLLAALSQIKPTVDSMIAKFGCHRVGVVLGTSTSGVRNTELALAGALSKPFHYKQQQMGA